MILAPLKSRLLIALMASALLMPAAASAQSGDGWRKGSSTVGELKHPGRRVKSVLVQCPAGCMALRFGWEWKFG
ncbi:hypothetical protein EN866_41250 [Mesorhizobium sp. M2D.F.Ca.ET.223.01.1.1]|nr:hypothetical protein EN866_41250 [Mesorhizobium sp. M2D.F.Ca.ET.223.01.1.1]